LSYAPALQIFNRIFKRGVLANTALPEPPPHSSEQPRSLN